MVIVISGHQSHEPGKYIFFLNGKYVIFHFFGQQLMKNASSPKIALDTFLGVHLPLKKTQANKI